MGIGGILFCVDQINLQNAWPEEDGLERIFLTIGQDNYRELSKMTFLERWFPILSNDSTNEYDGRIRVHGGLSRHYPKVSFKLDTYKGYPQKKVKSIQLSSQYIDTSFCRYRLARAFFSAAGIPTPEVSASHLFFDNDYHGVYLEIEMVDSLFFKRRNLPISSLYKSNMEAWFTTKTGILPEVSFDKKLPGNDMCYNDLEQLIMMIDKGITVADTAELHTMLDINNVLDYYAVSIMIGHYDGIVKNYYLYYNSKIQKFQFIPWDMDLTFNHMSLSRNYKNNLFEHLDKIYYTSYIKPRMKEIFNYEYLTGVLDSIANEAKTALRHDPWMLVESRNIDGEIDGLYYYLERLKNKLDNIEL